MRIKSQRKASWTSRRPESALLAAVLPSALLLFSASGLWAAGGALRDAASIVEPAVESASDEERLSALGRIFDGQEARKAVVISLDGAMPGTVQKMIEAGSLPNLAQLARKGTGVVSMTPPTPSMTPVSHATLYTGASPGKTGVLSMTFHEVSQAITQTISGFAVPLRAETLSQAAMRQGRTSASIGWPNTGPAGANWLVRFSSSDSYSFVTERKKTDWTPAPGVLADPEPYSGTLTLKTKDKTYLFYLLAAAGKEGYGELYVDDDKDLANGYAAKLAPSQWADISLNAEKTRGSRLKLMTMAKDLSSFKLYVGAVYSTNAEPRDYLEEISRNFGFFPGGGDYHLLQGGKIDEATYIEQERRLGDWFMEIARYTAKTKNPDLLMVYQSEIDGAQHQFFLTDPRQSGYSPERFELYQSYIQDAYKAADSRIGSLLSDLNEAANVFVVSDHGMAALHTAVSINSLLKKEGLSAEKKSGQRLRATGSGGSVHVYINKEGREKGGIVPEEQYGPLQERIVRVLKDFKDPSTGEKVFDIIRKKTELKDLGLENENSGDVFALSKPGYHLDHRGPKDDVAAPTSFYGMHGYDSNLEEMQALFMAAGPAIRSAGPLRVPFRLMDSAGQGRTFFFFGGDPLRVPINMLDFASTVAASMGMEAPKGSEGSPLRELLNEKTR